jgi:hypothetical protein
MQKLPYRNLLKITVNFVRLNKHNIIPTISYLIEVLLNKYFIKYIDYK